MIRATALARLKLYLQPDSEPTLSELEVDALLDAYALEDAQGIARDGEGWLGLWDIRAAKRKGWLLKAAKVVADVDYDVDGSKYTQDQLSQHCLAQAAQYSDAGTLTIAGVGGLE